MADERRSQPLVLDQPIVNPNGTPTLYFIRWAQERQIAIGDSITEEEADEIIQEWAANREINAGVGLSGGGPLSDDVTIDLEDTAVAPGTYTNATVTVDQQGRITFAESGEAPSGGGVLPAVSGIPPELVYAPDGSLIYVEV